MAEVFRWSIKIYSVETMKSFWVIISSQHQISVEVSKYIQVQFMKPRWVIVWSPQHQIQPSEGYSTVQSLLRQFKSCPSLSPLKISVFSTIKNNLGSNSLQQKRKGHTIISNRVWISYVIRLTASKFIIKEKIPRAHI